MLTELEIIDSGELGYYICFEDLFTSFASFYKKGKKHFIAINFSFTDEDTPPSEIQLKTHEILISSANQMMENIIQYLKQDEEYFIEFNGVYNVIEHNPFYINNEKYNYTSKEGFPLVEDITEFINHFTIDSINISDSEEDNISFIGFSGSCTWEIEHGFGVAFHGKKLLHVADWEYGNNPSWAKNENDHYLTEYFTKFHLLENLDERKSKLTKLSKSIEIENTAPYLEIFNWLIELKMIYGYRNKPCDLTAKEIIVLLKEIKELNFYGNTINKFPKNINLLENLTSLNLSFNKLNTIPIQITKLAALKKLSVNNNKIKQIPSQISHLTNLTSLDISCNKLEEIPKEIELLSNLQYLNLNHNKLSRLPKSIIKLKYLSKLSIKENNFTNLPDFIFDIKTLNSLDISSNKITSINETITKLKKLKFLDIRFNKIKKIPKTLFSDIPNLRDCYISVSEISLEDLNHIKTIISKKTDSDINTAIDYVIDNLNRQKEKDNSKQHQANKWWKFWE